jgi:hypothetical protein
MKLALPLVVILAVVASFAYADEVVIDSAYTMNYYMVPETQFCVWDPVMYNVDYTIVGVAGQTYTAVITVKSMGDTLKTTEKHKPGSYTTIFSNLAGAADVGNKTVNYQIKLKKGATLVDTETDTSGITVSECP